jgi:hypothetical protein
VNAFHAADRIVIPVADRASLREASKTFRLLERGQLGVDRARILFTLVDRRSRGPDEGEGLLLALREEAERRGWPCYRTFLSRSPRVESLISADDRPRSILHEARGTALFTQMREFALEVLEELSPAGSLRAAPAAPAVPGRPARSRTPEEDLDWKAALLRGVWRRRD